MYIYIVRHGQTDWNKKTKLQGRSDISLNEEGKKVAAQTGKGLSNIKFDRIISSPLKRAIQTAELIRGNRAINIEIDDRIIEMGFGSFEGLEFDKSRLHNYGELNNFFNHPHLYVPPEGAETINELRVRTASFMKELIEKVSADNILVVTHGAAISGLLAYINNLDDEHLWGGGVQQNCAVTVLKVENKNVSVVEVNKIYH